MIQGTKSTRRGDSGLYEVNLPLAGAADAVCYSAASLELVHRRMMHAGQTTIKEMERLDSVRGLQLAPQEKGANMEPCQSCLEGKAKKQPLPLVSKTPVNMPLEIVHADL